ncbi:hypothetical protein E2C01_096103 [Portunus trituberculatus]|uniref:Uncharacterized protein n=1 Tax=Portunus trituberculatus TaxID=210409 RepID=A0A5B7JUS7_PORTR|nr:hypothetical protein [Portunus trituberculatus]
MNTWLSSDLPNDGVAEDEGDAVYHSATHVLGSVHAVVQSGVQQGGNHGLLNPAPEMRPLLRLPREK